MPRFETPQELRLYNAIFNILNAEAKLQGQMICTGHPRHWEPQLQEFITAFLDAKCHGHFREPEGGDA